MTNLKHLALLNRLQLFVNPSQFSNTQLEKTLDCEVNDGKSQTSSFIKRERC